MGIDTASEAMTVEEIVALNRAHTFFSWSVQGAIDPIAVDGDVFVAHGRTRYFTDDRSSVDREFANVFVCRFDEDGRCREFTEYYMRRRAEPSVEDAVVD